MKTSTHFKTIFHVVLFLFLLNGYNGYSQNSSQFYDTPYNNRNSGSFDRGSNLLSLSYGFPNFLYNEYRVYNANFNGRHLGIGPLILKYEFAIRDEVSLGIVLQGASKTWRYTTGNATFADRAWGIGSAFMGYYHFNKLIPVTF